MKANTITIIAMVLISCTTQLVRAQYEPFEPDANTMGLWHFDENAGVIAYDSSGNGLDGELQNGVAWDSLGRFGNCVSFDYSGPDGQRVFVDDDPLLDTNDELTIDAWIYLLPTHDWSVIASKWYSSSQNPAGQYILLINDENKMSFVCAHNDQTYFIRTDDVIPFNQWILVSAIFDNGHMALYVDGIRVAYDQAPFTSLTSVEYTHDELNIGDHWRDTSYPYTFEGRIDEVRISDIARYEVTGVDQNIEGPIPNKMTTTQNYPNPFNASTTIEYGCLRRGE